jgi:hypothetical protein
MTDLEGRWARLPSGRLVHIIGIDGDMVVAETTRGTTVDRPLTYVMTRWILLADDSLTVQGATKPEDLKARLEANPVDVVVDAIRELGGEAETAQIKELLAQTLGEWVGTGDTFKVWWRQIQQKLGDDPRIDDSKSLERRYRLLADGEQKRQAYRDRVSDGERNGRRLADAPTLRRARARAREKKAPLTDDDRIELRLEAALAQLPELDSTDRFMAAELGTWIGAITVEEAVANLGEDLLLIDLMRVPLNASRDAALTWLRSWLDTHLEDWTWREADPPPTVASAAALGKRWGPVAESLAAALGLSRSTVIRAAITWSYPGSEESRPWKIPEDFESYGDRLKRFEGMWGTAEAEMVAGIEHGALLVLKGLAESRTYGETALMLLRQVAQLAADARKRLGQTTAAPAVAAHLPPARFMVLLSALDATDRKLARIYVDAVEQAFERDPDAYAEVVRLLGSLISEDSGRIALGVARRVAARGQITALASVAALLAVDPGARADSVAIAGTLEPDRPRVALELDKIASLAADGLLAGNTETPGALVFSPSTWRTFATEMIGRIEAAAANERAARQAATDAARRSVEVAAAVKQAQAALATSRLSTEIDSRLSNTRLAANILKPVAAALADSVEAPSLEALQDRLAATLDRARIEPILEPGIVQPFDPDRHRWVDEGAPTDLVTAVSPGFMARLEGEDDFVLVPARVVAPRQG